MKFDSSNKILLMLRASKFASVKIECSFGIKTFEGNIYFAGDGTLPIALTFDENSFCEIQFHFYEI